MGSEVSLIENKYFASLQTFLLPLGLIASEASNHSLNKQSQILRRRILKKSVAGFQVLFLAHFSFNLGKITYMSRGSCILYVYRKKTPYFSCLNLVLTWCCWHLF